jgi:alpha-L-arabinofuranosidase|eukprot:COSAG01_NODE_7344_length_3242_cov_7.433344_4_plen_202_part_00
MLSVHLFWPAYLHVCEGVCCLLSVSLLSCLITRASCTTGQQGADNGDYQIKFLADKLVRAPYWYAQQMLSQSHQPNVVGGFHQLYYGSYSSNSSDVVVSGGGSKVFVDWMAAVSDDGKTLVLRFENPNALPVALNASVADGPWASLVAVRTLSGPSLAAANDYDTPCAVCPANSTASVSASGELMSTLVPFSFTVMTMRKR